MRKEPPKQPRTGRAWPSREKEISTAAGGCITWEDAPNSVAWEAMAPFFRVRAFEELRREIDVMAGELQRLPGSSVTSAEEARALGSLLDQLRVMANEVERGEMCRDGTSPELRSQNREFETMVWILRNNLDQIAMRACA